jgi:hypothetical protein
VLVVEAWPPSLLRVHQAAAGVLTYSCCVQGCCVQGPLLRFESASLCERVGLGLCASSQPCTGPLFHQCSHVTCRAQHLYALGFRCPGFALMLAWL